MFERYTERSRLTIFRARCEAIELGSPSIEPDHLLLAFLREPDSLAGRFLSSLPDVDSIRKQIEEHTMIREKLPDNLPLPLGQELKRVLAYVAEEAERMKSPLITTGHMLLGLLREDGCFAAGLLRERGVQVEKAREAIQLIPSEDAESPHQAEYPQPMFERSRQGYLRAIFFARHEASEFGASSIEPEHLLLAFLREHGSLAGRYLSSFPDLNSIRKQVETNKTMGEKISTSVDLPISQELLRALSFADEEAASLPQITTGHLLLGLLREESCFAAGLLRERGLQLDKAREVLQTLRSEDAMLP